MQKISRTSKVSVAFARTNTKQEIVWMFAGAPITPAASLYCALNSECGLFGPSRPDCSRLSIVAASIFAMLAAYSSSCMPETTLTR